MMPMKDFLYRRSPRNRIFRERPAERSRLILRNSRDVDQIFVMLSFDHPPVKQISARRRLQDVYLNDLETG
jgi:hypothetical protein